ncbi:unnamed protein product, partial [Meganyctiphanes norvegica]
IKSINLRGEKESNDAAAAEILKVNLTQVIAKYFKDPTKVYNVDKTGFCCNKLPSRSYVSATNLLSGGFKQPKRGYLFTWEGIWRGRKLKPVVIGKAKKTRAFGNRDISSLHVYYEAQANAWMASNFFFFFFFFFNILFW